MPNPFSSKKQEDQPRQGSQEVIKVTNSTLTCEFCFAESSEGTYIPSGKRLFWTCVGCGRENAVKGIEIE